MSPFTQAPDSPIPAALLRRPHWFACRTRARSEKRVRDLLARRGLEAFLPLVEEERTWSDREKTVTRPLFSGYVFARFEVARIYDALRVPHLVDVASPNGYPTPVREDALESVRRMVEGANRAGESPRGVEFHRLLAGQEIVVTAGPFEGMRGVLVRDEEGGGYGAGAAPAREASRVAVRIEALRQATSVLVPRRMCRVVEEAAAPAGVS